MAVGGYKVITLYGSTKFKDDFIAINQELTLAGNIVISVGLFGHADKLYSQTDDTKANIVVTEEKK